MDTTCNQVIKSMVRKWKNLAQGRRRRLAPLRKSKSENENSRTMADKGHFVIYTRDNCRHAIPLAYLRTKAFQELFRLAEEEFGLSSDGPITLPCDAELLDHIVSLTRRGIVHRREKSLIRCVGIIG